MTQKSVNFEIVSIDETLIDQIIVFYKDNFLRYENVCLATNILSSEESVKEMIVWLRELLKDGISFAARDTLTKELVGFCINKIANQETNANFQRLFSEFKTPPLRFIDEYSQCMESTFDLFKEWHLDCCLEIAFLSTRNDYAGCGVATSLVKHTVNFARRLSNDELSVCQTLPVHIRGLKPQAVCSIFSSLYSQKIGEKLGFKTVCRISNKDFIVGEESFAYYIDPKHEYSTFVALRL